MLRCPELRLRRRALWAAARPNGTGSARLGLIVGKRVLKRAVDRNRAKRLIRESFRQRVEMPAVDVVVRLAAPRVVAADVEVLFAALEDALAKRMARR